MSCRIAIASGGTGGHFYPTLAIATELRSRGQEVLLLVAGQHADDHLRLAAEQGLDAEAVPAFRLHRNLRSAVSFPFLLASSVRSSRQLIRARQPDAMLGMGSFAAVPACLAALREGIPLILHEGNAWMGRANRFLSRWARVAGVALPLDPDCVPRCPTVHAGMPLRRALLDAAANPPPPEKLRSEFGLHPETRTVLVFGGSQGARFLNDLMRDLAANLGRFDPPVQVLHFTGTDDNAAVLEAYEQAGVKAHVRRSDPDIQNAYIAADLVICRAGASSSCELALFGKPAILIPLPTAAEDHQTVNARLLARSDAAVHLPQPSASVGEVTALLQSWLAGADRFAQLHRHVRAFAKADAAARMAELCLEHACKRT